MEIPFSDQETNPNQKVHGLTFTYNDFIFGYPNNFKCYAAKERNLSEPCSTVVVIPSSDNQNQITLNYQCLTIQCNFKTNRRFMFVNDDIGNITLNKLELYYPGTNRGFREICIISTQKHPAISRKELEKLWQPKCLVLALDFPDNLFFRFPSTETTNKLNCCNLL